MCRSGHRILVDPGGGGEDAADHVGVAAGRGHDVERVAQRGEGAEIGSERHHRLGAVQHGQVIAVRVAQRLGLRDAERAEQLGQRLGLRRIGGQCHRIAGTVARDFEHAGLAGAEGDALACRIGAQHEMPASQRRMAA